jgi:hypothetical protein
MELVDGTRLHRVTTKSPAFSPARDLARLPPASLAMPRCQFLPGRGERCESGTPSPDIAPCSGQRQPHPQAHFGQMGLASHVFEVREQRLCNPLTSGGLDHGKPLHGQMINGSLKTNGRHRRVADPCQHRSTVIQGALHIREGLTINPRWWVQHPTRRQRSAHRSGI